MYTKSVDIPTFFLGRWVFGRWVFGRWMFGRWVARQGHPRVSRGKGRWVAPWPPVSRRPGWSTPSRRHRRPPRRRRPPLAAAAPKTEPTREPSRPPTPKTPPRRQRGLDSACILTLPRSGRNFFRRWMFVFRRWVLNIRRWVTNPTLGVGWHGPCVGRWMRWMPLARALGDGEGRRRGQRAGTTVPLSLGIGRVP